MEAGVSPIPDSGFFFKMEDHLIDILASNKQPKGEPDPSFIQEASARICVLLRDGRLFGVFTSVQDARYWCAANELNGFSTYDLASPDSIRADNKNAP